MHLLPFNFNSFFIFPFEYGTFTGLAPLIVAARLGALGRPNIWLLCGVCLVHFSPHQMGGPFVPPVTIQVQTSANKVVLQADQVLVHVHAFARLLLRAENADALRLEGEHPPQLHNKPLRLAVQRQVQAGNEARRRRATVHLREHVVHKRNVRLSEVLGHFLGNPRPQRLVQQFLAHVHTAAAQTDTQSQHNTESAQN